MTTRPGVVVAGYGLGLTSAFLVAGGFSLGVHLANLHNGLIAAAFTAVGVFVLRLRPGHREGWLFIAAGVAHAVMFFGRQYGLYAGNHGRDSLPAATWVLWLGVWPLALVLVLAAVTMMSFPDGRLPSRAWRAVVVAMVLTGVLLSFASALWPVEYADDALAVPYPLHVGGYGTAQRLWNVLGPTSYILFQFVWVGCVLVRLRHAQGDEARQLKWFAYAVTMGAVAMALGLIVFGSPILGVLAVPVVPIAAGVAIVKYRLYDIDVVINKTLVIGAMAGVITAGYVALVVGVGRLVGASHNPDPVLSLFATAIVAVAFEPVRRRVQRAADRLVYGARPTPYEALSRLSSQLSAGRGRSDLLTGLAYRRRGGGRRGGDAVGRLGRGSGGGGVVATRGRSGRATGDGAEGACLLGPWRASPRPCHRAPGNPSRRRHAHESTRRGTVRV